jgi:hypothetical protein
MLDVVGDRQRKLLYLIFEHACPLHPSCFIPEAKKYSLAWGMRLSMLQSIMVQLLCALRHLHARGVAHGAITMDCITVDWSSPFTCTAKLACWGIRRNSGDDMQGDLRALGRVFAQLWLPDDAPPPSAPCPASVTSLLTQLQSGALHCAEQALQHPWFDACFQAQLAEPACLLDCIHLDDAPCPFLLAECRAEAASTHALNAATLHACHQQLPVDDTALPVTSVSIFQTPEHTSCMIP